MRNFWNLAIVVWILGLALYVQTQATLPKGFYEHAMEKVFLWEMYDLFCSMEEEGAKKQGLIFPHDPKRSTGSHNIGLSSDGKMDYFEFMFRANGGHWDMKTGNGRDKINRNLVVPSGHDHLAAVQSLMDNKEGGGNFNFVEVNRQWELTQRRLQRNKGGSDGDTLYRLFFESVADKFTQYRNDPKKAEKFTDDRMDRLNKLVDSIVKLRMEDTSEWMIRNMQDPPDEKDITKGGLGLDLTGKTRDLPSEYPGTTYKKLDVIAVLREHRSGKGYLTGPLKRFGDRKGFRTWMNSMANPTVDPDVNIPGLVKSSKSHVQTIGTWKKIQSKMPALSAKCGKADPPSPNGGS